jgi:hypothetical protein
VDATILGVWSANLPSSISAPPDGSGIHALSYAMRFPITAKPDSPG